MPYRVYFAARYGRRDELNRYRQQLLDAGIEVTSHWLTVDPPAAVDQLTDSHWRVLAQTDTEDIRRADALVAFSEVSRGGGGGRHVELGIAIALEKLVVVVGTPEHLFHQLSWVRIESSWDAALTTLRRAASVSL